MEIKNFIIIRNVVFYYRQIITYSALQQRDTKKIKKMPVPTFAGPDISHLK